MEKEQALSWLQRLKDESWEAELLVSVASILAIMQVFPLLASCVDFFINNLRPEQYFVGYMISFSGYLAFGILGAFFVIHFSLRAYWIGLVGLNSVFPDYSVKDSAYSEIYTKKMSDLLPKVPATIKSLDEICSVIFSASFALLMLYLYAGLLSAFLLTIYAFLNTYVSTILLVVIAVFMLISTLGSIIPNIKKYKQNVKVQTWYFHLVVWSSKVFYGPFYKYLLQIMMMFGSNYKQKKAIVRTLLIMVLFGFGLGILQIFQSNFGYLLRSDVPQDETRVYPEHYSYNNFEKTFLLAPEIESKIVSTNVLSLFVPIFENETKRMEKNCNIEDKNTKKLDDKMRQLYWRTNLDCYAKSIKLVIDNKAIPSEFIKIDHAITGQFGLFAFVSLNDISQGAQELTVIKTIDDDQKKWHIRFYFSP